MTAARIQMSSWQWLNYGSQWRSRWVTGVVLGWQVRWETSLCPVGTDPLKRSAWISPARSICRRRSANLGRRRCRRRQKPDEVHWASSLIVELRLRQVVLAPGSLWHVLVSDSLQGHSANNDSLLSFLIRWFRPRHNNIDGRKIPPLMEGGNF